LDVAPERAGLKPTIGADSADYLLRIPREWVPQTADVGHGGNSICVYVRETPDLRFMSFVGNCKFN